MSHWMSSIACGPRLCQLKANHAAALPNIHDAAAMVEMVAAGSGRKRRLQRRSLCLERLR
jgi:hypothetical protein